MEDHAELVAVLKAFVKVGLFLITTGATAAILSKIVPVGRGRFLRLVDQAQKEVKAIMFFVGALLLVSQWHVSPGGFLGISR